MKPTYKVLIIDDSVTIRAMMQRVLGEDAALRASAVRSADEADELLAGEAFDVVTLDVEMPGRSGLEFLPELVTHHHLPVIMLSASTGAGAAACAEALRGGALACFDKADAVRQAPELIRLVKLAARGRLRPPPPEAEQAPA